MRSFQRSATFDAGYQTLIDNQGRAYSVHSAVHDDPAGAIAANEQFTDRGVEPPEILKRRVSEDDLVQVEQSMLEADYRMASA